MCENFQACSVQYKVIAKEDNIMHMLIESDRMNTTSNLSVKSSFSCNHGPYPIKQIWKYLHVVMSNSKSFIPEILKVVSLLGKKAHLF